MRVDGQDPSFGHQRFRGWGKIHRWIFRLQVTLAVPEPWVTSDSRLVGSLLVAEWWPDETSSESKDFLFARKMRHYFQSNRRPGRSFFRCFMLHASATNNFFIVSWSPISQAFKGLCSARGLWSLVRTKKSLSDVSSLPKYLTDLQDLQKCLWQPQDLDWYIGSLNLHGNRRWGIWMRQWRCHRASLWWGFWCAQQ